MPCRGTQKSKPGWNSMFAKTLGWTLKIEMDCGTTLFFCLDSTYYIGEPNMTKK